MSTLCVIVLVISTSVISSATTQQPQNCSKILCPTRENDCASLDQIAKCGEYSMLLPGITDVPIHMQYDKFSGLFVLNDFKGKNVIFEKTATLWSKLGNVNIVTLSISNFCDAQNLKHDCRLSCHATDPRFQSINVDNFAEMTSVQKVIFSENCACDITGDISKKFPSVISIKFDNNYFVKVPTMLKNATTLRSLSLNANIIQTVKIEDFEKNILLQELTLNKNCLHHLPSGLLSRLPHLEMFSVDENNLETFPESLLSNTTNLRNFIAGFNNLKTLPSKLFHNTAKVKEIKLNNNQLSSIPEDLLKNCDQLEKLFLNDNQLFTLPLNAFQSTINLNILYLYRNNFTKIPIIKFGTLVKTPSIDLSYNNISIVHGPIINRMPQVFNLTLSHNCLTFLPQNESSEHVQQGVDIKGFICEDCCITELQSQIFVGVTGSLSLKGNNISKLDMSDLKYLSRFKSDIDLSQNEIRNINVTFDYPLNKSRVGKNVTTNIILAGNPVVCDCALLNFMLYVKKVGDGVNTSTIKFDVNNLQCQGPVGVVGKNVLDLSFDQLITEYFEDCPENCSCQLVCFNTVITVKCNNANLHLFPTSYPTIFHKLSVNFTGNYIKFLPPENDLLWHRLTVLNLKNNELTSLNNIPSTSTITDFNIQDNKLTKLEPELINFITTNTTTKAISLSGNPWLCNCDLKQKYNIILYTKHVIIKDQKQLNCTFNGITYKFTDYDEFCVTNTKMLTWLFGSLAVIAALACVISILFFKYKLQIKYFLFTKNLCMWWVSEEDIDADKQYDAFVSYSSLDGEWVNQFLVNGLENEYPFYKLCFHERDWPGGALIVDQIVRSVENSRRTIIVLTDNFVASEWSLTEFTVAYQRAIEDNVKRIIVVVPFGLPDLDKCSEEFRSFVKLTTYIEANKPHFWRKLRCSLPRRNNVVKDDVDARIV